MTIASVARLSAALGDRYRVERSIGAGGMASVFLAEDLRHHRKVAIKVLRPELSAVLGADRFLQEIRLTANLQHPHILPLFDSGAADGLLFYVMPFVEGETVRDRLDREGRLPIADALRIAGQVAAALDYAHRRGIVHRDIKPANILLHDDSALVADFGIALAADTAGDRITATGVSLGTPYYMSPEQALGEGVVDHRSDIYALGATLYEMLTGVPPFTGSTGQAVLAQVITGKPVPPVRLRPDTPASASNAVLTALQKEPGARFASAAAFQSALHPSSAPARRPARAHGALGLVVLAAIGMLSYILRPVHRTAPPEASAPAAFLPRRIAVIPFRRPRSSTPPPAAASRRRQKLS